MDAVFSRCAKVHLNRPATLTDRLDDKTEDERETLRGLKTLSSLIAHSARPTADTLKELSQHYKSGDRFKSCCLRAVTRAANPFIPGLTLSTRLGAAARQASKGKRRAITDVKLSVEELLLEIFERLPQTVTGFEERGWNCAGLFEPIELEPRRKDEPINLGGPLDMIISEQQQLEAFTRVPLVMDYLSSKFMSGLPNLFDTEGVLRNKAQLDNLAKIGLDLGFSGPWTARLQAARAQDLSLTFLPGAQFIVAGVVAAPNDYYKVPAMRMALDFVVYVAMVAALSFFVLFHMLSEFESEAGDDGIKTHGFSVSEASCAMIFVTVREPLKH